MVKVSYTYTPPEENRSQGKMHNWSRVKETQYYYEWQHDLNDRISVAITDSDHDEGYETIILIDGKKERSLHITFMDDRYSRGNREDMRKATAQWLKRHPLEETERGYWRKQDANKSMTNLPHWRNVITGTTVMYKSGYDMSGDSFYIKDAASDEGGLFNPLIEGYNAGSEEERNRWMRNHPYR